MKKYKYGVIAIHGGDIEKGTEEIANNIALKDFPIYVNRKGPHITSTKFRDKELEKIFDICEVIISIHGEHELTSFTIIGGLEEGLINVIRVKLKKNKFNIKEPIRKLHGESNLNVCNLGVSKKGVQLELSKKLRDDLMSDSEKMYLYTRSIRDALFQYKFI